MTHTRQKLTKRELCLFLCALSACVLEEGRENESTAQPPLTDLVLVRSPFAIALSCQMAMLSIKLPEKEIPGI